MYRLRHSYPTLVILLVLSGCIGCSGSGINSGDVNLISIEEEWQLGQQLEQEIGQQMTLVNDQATVSYISQMGQQMVRGTEMAQLPWEFHVVADPAVNAFNTPGGHVYVHTGLIEKAGSAAELASVIGHEIAHGTARHATERLTKQYGLSIAAGILLGNDPGLIQQIVAQIAATGAIAKFSRDDEREADALGIRYMYDAGYAPIGMARMFERLIEERRRQPGAVDRFFGTHPLTEDRVADARQRAAQLPNRSGLVTDDGRLDDIKRRVARYN